ncbi:hypothetical protein ON010_g18584 [Phytophthora cinnamomi]|nr:hypothetical protein ON010_g18584 [Phytophthora cinnamomi]
MASLRVSAALIAASSALLATVPAQTMVGPSSDASGGCCSSMKQSWGFSEELKAKAKTLFPLSQQEDHVGLLLLHSPISEDLDSMAPGAGLDEIVTLALFRDGYTRLPDSSVVSTSEPRWIEVNFLERLAVRARLEDGLGIDALRSLAAATPAEQIERISAFDTYEQWLIAHVQELQASATSQKPLRVKVHPFEEKEGENLHFWVRAIELAMDEALVVTGDSLVTTGLGGS